MQSLDLKIHFLAGTESNAPCWLKGSKAGRTTHLHQVVVGSIQLLVQLDDQALEKRRELSLLLPGLWTKRMQNKMRIKDKNQNTNKKKLL